MRTIARVREIALIIVLRKVLFWESREGDTTPCLLRTSVKAASIIVKKEVAILYASIGINTPHVLSKVDKVVFSVLFSITQLYAYLYAFYKSSQPCTINGTGGDVLLQYQLKAGSFLDVRNDNRRSKMGLGTIAIIKLILFTGMCVFGAATIFFLVMALRIDIIEASEESKLNNSLRFDENEYKKSA